MLTVAKLKHARHHYVQISYAQFNPNGQQICKIRAEICLHPYEMYGVQCFDSHKTNDYPIMFFKPPVPNVFQIVRKVYICTKCHSYPQINYCLHSTNIHLLKPTGHVMHQHFNIQQLYVLPTLYLCVLYLSENKLRLVPLTA